VWVFSEFFFLEISKGEILSPKIGLKICLKARKPSFHPSSICQFWVLYKTGATENPWRPVEERGHRGAREEGEGLK
jgi:hypothetical protein